jgi:O-antigen ligase
MRRCPHCQSQGLRWAELALSSEAGPARCVTCGGLASTNVAFSLYASAFSSLLFIICGFAAIYLWSWWPLLTFVALLLAYPIILLALPLTPTTRAAARRAGWVQLVAVATVVLCVVVAFLFSHEF